MRKKQNKPKEGVDFRRRLLFSFPEGRRQVSLRVLELYDQVGGRSHLLFVASILKKVCTTFRASSVSGRLPVGSPFVALNPLI